MSGSFLREHSFKEMEMIKAWGCVLVAVGLTFAFCTHAFASGEKIGYLNVATVITHSTWGKQISKRLQREQDKLTSAVQTKKDEFTAARDSFMKKRDIMDANARAQKEQQLEQMAASLQQLMQESQNKWTEEKKAAMMPLFKKMYAVAGKVSREKGYDMIVDRSALIVANPKDDITGKVISELDRSH